MKIAISGASGFIGSYLCQKMTLQGHCVVPIIRSDFAQGVAHLAARLNGADVLINLAGASINRRWSKRYKREISGSRLDTTRALVAAFGKMKHPPKQLLNASAIGAFSEQRTFFEHDTPDATDFLGKLSRQWESAALEARQLGVKVKILRFGLVLGRDGGLLKSLWLPFNLGLGGPIGNGLQAFSWIHIEDLFRAVEHIMQLEQEEGPFHLCAPEITNNRGFTRELGKALNRPARLPVPGFVLKLAFGDGAEVMLSGQSVSSSRLPETGFSFKYPDVTSALFNLVKQKRLEGVKKTAHTSRSEIG